MRGRIRGMRWVHPNAMGNEKLAECWFVPLPVGGGLLFRGKCFCFVYLVGFLVAARALGSYLGNSVQPLSCSADM